MMKKANKTKKREQMLDLLIVGAGPAGLSAAVNAASEGLNTLVIECTDRIGGQAKFSSRVENYAGFPSGISGADLMSRFHNQAVKFGTDFQINIQIASLKAEGNLFLTTLSDGSDCVSRAILLACGLMPRKLAALSAFDGKGVFYGAMPNEAADKKGKSVVVVGGANSAGQAAINFADYGANVTVLVREDKLGAMSQYLIDRIQNNPAIKVIFNASIAAASGSTSLESVTLNSGESLTAEFVFVFIGFQPETNWISALCQCDDHGFLRCDGSFMTSTSGIFVAGDVSAISVKRIASAVGEGAQAVSYIHKYLAATWGA